MKKIFSVLFITTFLLQTLSAQNNIGIGTLTPNVSALLDLTATDKGFLVPRTDTTTVNNAGNAIADGLLIYQLADKTFYYYDISVPMWKSVGGTLYIAGTGITITGNTISATGDDDWLFNGLIFTTATRVMWAWALTTLRYHFRWQRAMLLGCLPGLQRNALPHHPQELPDIIPIWAC